MDKKKEVGVKKMMSIIEQTVQARQAKFDYDAEKPNGPLFTFLVGAGFSVTAGVAGVSHLVSSLEEFKKYPNQSWNSIFDKTLEISLEDRGLTAAELTDHYFSLIDDVLALPQARHDFITAAIQWASSKRVQLNVEGILLAVILISGTDGNIPLQKNAKNSWLAKAFAKHVFTTNFDEVLPNTFYYGNHPVEIIDSAGIRPINTAAEYPTLVYLHGRHLHFDIRNTNTELHKGNNPLSPPCMTPNPGFHDPYAKSKSLATTVLSLSRGNHLYGFPSWRTPRPAGRTRIERRHSGPLHQ